MVYCDVSVQHHQLGGPKNKRQTNVWKMGKKASEKTETSTEGDKAKPLCRFYVCCPPLSITVYTVDPCFGCECCNTTKELLSKAKRLWLHSQRCAKLASLGNARANSLGAQKRAHHYWWLVHGPMARFHHLPGTSNHHEPIPGSGGILHEKIKASDTKLNVIYNIYT